jgi:AcrR family transcriptional regulator
MATPERRRGRAHDAAGAREAILNAAEEHFALHGFDGARMGAIAKASSYNSSLIFHYFGDKLGLYTAVLKRSDQHMSALLARIFTPLLEDETIAADAGRFSAFLTAMFEAFFDYMVEHPRFMRMINWEQAEGWQTFLGVAAHFETADITRLESIFARAQRAGLLRPDLDSMVVLLLIQQVCWTVPAALPMYDVFLAGRNLAPASVLGHLRAQIVAFLVAGCACVPGSRDV